MKLVYEWSLCGEENSETLHNIAVDTPLTEEDYVYITGVIAGIRQFVTRLDELIAKHAVGWSVERIGKVDLAILRLAVYEIDYRDDVPPAVAINEAVELSKRYGTDDSPAFINGVLGGYMRSCVKEATERS